jgi:hypothetical protein
MMGAPFYVPGGHMAADIVYLYGKYDSYLRLPVFSGLVLSDAS